MPAEERDVKQASLTITLSHDPADLERLRSEWTALQASSATDSVFMTWEWVATWWQHFGSQGELWLLQARDDDGRLIGLGPLMRRERRPVAGMRWQQLELIGSAAAGDHLDLIVEKGQEHRAIPAFLSALEQQRARWDVLSLTYLPEGSPNLALLRHSGLLWEEPQVSVCPYTPLPRDWETFFRSLSRSKREQQRRYRRRLDEAFPGGWEWRLAATPAEADEALTEMIRLHNAKWERRDAPGGFDDPVTVAFHRAVARRFLEQGWLRLFSLLVNGRFMGAIYNFQHRGRVSFFSSGFADEVADFRPGHILHEIALRHAIESGAHEYDFLRGEEEYKYRWGAQDRRDYSLSWAVSRRARLRQRAIGLATRGWRVVKHALPKDVRRWIANAARR